MSRARILPLLRAGRVGRAGRESCGSAGVFKLLSMEVMADRRSRAPYNPRTELLLLPGLLAQKVRQTLKLRAKASDKRNRNRRRIDTSGIEYYPLAKRSPCRVERLARGGHSLPHPVQRSCPGSSSPLCIALPPLARFRLRVSLTVPAEIIKYHNVLICLAPEPIKSGFSIFFVFPVPHPLN